MKLKLLALSMIVASFIATGCGKKEDDAQKAADAAAKATEQMSQTSGSNGGSSANKTPGVAVAAKTLASFLATPAGYKMDGEPETMEMDFQGQKYSHAQGKYTNGDKEITISIFDYNYITGLSAAYSTMLNMNMESNDESFHSEKIAGFPGWFNWHKKDNNGTIGVVVNDRIFVVTESHGGVSQDELKAAASGVNYSGIAAAAK